MANMTGSIQLPPDIVQTTGGSGAHKHMNYKQSNINGYDQSVLSNETLTFITIIVWIHNIIMTIALTKCLRIVMSYH